MNRDRAIEILETYRPGEGLESDPEVRAALQMADADPGLARLQEQTREFDDKVRDQMRRIEIPADLRQRILDSAGSTAPGPADIPAPSPSGKLLPWLHPAAFAAAAAIVILLALTFTFWRKPEVPLNPNEERPTLALADSNLIQTARTLYASMRPRFKSGDGSEIRNFLSDQGGIIPVHLPEDIPWDKSFACDVLEINGTKVSIICFTAPDNSRSMHLFTFQRADFPNVEVPRKPRICTKGAPCGAAWRDEEQIHVLFSDKGEENLLAVLDI